MKDAFHTRANAPALPRLIGVIHLPALPGAPASAHSVESLVEGAARDAKALLEAGFEGCIVENYGDVPFEKDRVAPITVAVMSRIVAELTARAPTLSFGVNVLRNDAEAALAVAVAAGARFVRVNVHVGARLTDQGVIEGRAANTLRVRRALCADHVSIFADVAVKHSAALAPYPLEQEVEDAVKRGRAEAVLVTGDGTGKGVDLDRLAEVAKAAGDKHVYVASGATPDSLRALVSAGARGVIVGSVLRADGCAGGPIDPKAAQRFAAAWRDALQEG